MVHTNTNPSMGDVIATLNALPNDPRYIARLEVEAALQASGARAAAAGGAAAAGRSGQLRGQDGGAAADVAEV